MTFYSHIVNYKTLKILIKNAFDQPLYILRWYKLDYLPDMTYDNYFLMDTWFAYDTAVIPPSSHFFSNLNVGPTLLPTNFLIETVLDNGIRVYRDVGIVNQISDLVTEYPSI